MKLNLEKEKLSENKGQQLTLIQEQKHTIDTLNSQSELVKHCDLRIEELKAAHKTELRDISSKLKTSEKSLAILEADKKQLEKEIATKTAQIEALEKEYKVKAF